MDLLQAWQLVVLPFIAATLGAWFTAHFSLRRFFREKEWERKTLAYTAIFEALRVEGGGEDGCRKPRCTPGHRVGHCRGERHQSRSSVRP
jgi:hypothetical protein